MLLKEGVRVLFYYFDLHVSDIIKIPLKLPGELVLF